MNKGYKGNRPTSAQVEKNYLRGQLKTLRNKYERWERVNQKNMDKGLSSKYSKEKFDELSLQIKLWEEKLYG
jgi:hypothetical protein